jgi:hypothetical protein
MIAAWLLQRLSHFYGVPLESIVFIVVAGMAATGTRSGRLDVPLVFCFLRKVEEFARNNTQCLGDFLLRVE